MAKINYQNSIDGNTILHEIYSYYTTYLYNNDQKTPFHLAQTNDIRQIFKLLHSDLRFSFIQNNCLSKYDIKCQSYSLINEKSFYEWELVDDLAYQNDLRLCDELKPYTFLKFLEK